MGFRDGNRRWKLVAALLVVLLAVAVVILSRDSWPWQAAVDFNREVRPIFNERCISCHGGVRREAGFSLLFPEEARKGGESGKPAIVPGDPGASELIRRITHSDPQVRMPAEGPPLSSAEIRTLRRWIAQGAPWEPHWAYVPPKAHPLPPVSDPEWPANGIDYFVLARLDREGLSPSPPADCATLLRRLSLDLIGLPPTYEETQAFCQDPSPEAYRRAVDRLLDSPRFGERWAAMWLDLARYADSKGYEADRHRTIWKYRDWVIQAFNDDLPFDQFTVQQLAGDLLPDESQARLVATAFHRNTMTNDEGGTDDEEFRIAAVIDRVNTTWEVWMGTTMGCVQCHGHPYDPFRQRDYYRFFAFLNNTEDADRVDEKPVAYSFSEEKRVAGQQRVQSLHRLRRRLDEAGQSSEVQEERRGWEERLREVLKTNPKPAKFENQVIPEAVLQIVRVPEEQRTREQVLKLADFYTTISPRLEGLRKALTQEEKALQELEPVTTPVLRELPEERRRKTYLLERGSWMARGEEVAAGVPDWLAPLPAGAPSNRMGMALWLVSPEHPLTARVTVNRFWAQLFGTGIVETLEDFGSRGLPPSHPELLDWLALQFIQEHDWSVKKLLRQIVLSSTYQQSSQLRPELLQKDPRNRLLARGPRVRLSGEQIRDQALAVSGLLSPKMFGPSVMPPQPPGLWNNPYDQRKWETSEGEDRYRRALYTYWRRTSPYPSLITFDAPSREVCVSRRVTTNTPLQALVLWNDPVYVEAAQHLARRALDCGGSTPAERVTNAYRLALARDPTPERVQVLEELYQQAQEHYQGEPAGLAALTGEEKAGPEQGALVVVANTLLNLDEFITKE